MFHKAQRSRVFLKLAVTGPSGSGKSYSALRIARGLVGPEGKIAAIDTENGSLSLYDDVENFDVADLDDFSPEAYIAAIDAAVAAGYEVVIIDSFSHAWKFILDYKGSLDARGGNQMMNWKLPKERMEKLKQRVLQSKIHVICNLRSKTEFVQNDKNGYIKAGLAAIGEPDVEYEFTVVFALDMGHKALAGTDGQGKDRTGLFDKLGTFTPSHKTGEMLAEWLQAAPDQTVKVQASTDDGGSKPAPKQVSATVQVWKWAKRNRVVAGSLCIKSRVESKPATVSQVA